MSVGMISCPREEGTVKDSRRGHMSSLICVLLEKIIFSMHG